MPSIDSCAKCNSARMIPNARIVDRGDYNYVRDWTIHVYEHPEAILFKGTHEESLKASICGECGYVETYVEDPDALYSAYLRSKPEQARGHHPSHFSIIKHARDSLVSIRTELVLCDPVG